MPRLPLLVLLAGCGGGVVQIGDDGLTPTGDPSTPVPTPPATPAPMCSDVLDAPEGAFLERDLATTDAFAPCSTALHAFAGAAASTVVLEYMGPDATLQILDLNEAILQTDTVRTGDSVAYTLTWSGEHLVRILPETPDPVDSIEYGLVPTCADACDLVYTRYPLFFMHGMAGTDSFLGALDYWYEVRERLEPLGYAVHFEAVEPFQSSEVRALQWWEHIQDVIDTGQARRFNLIGHSQGGIDARFLTGVLDQDERVASVTTISTPHQGTELLGIVSGFIDNPGITGVVVDEIFDSLTALYGTSNDQDIIAQLDTLSAETMAEFNATVIDRPDVHYASWAGTSCGLLEVICQLDNGGEIVTPLFGATHLALSLTEGENDGLVSVQSAMWGDFLGTIPADHLDEVGLMPGTTAPGFDHLQFFEDDAARLRDMGL